MTSISAQVETGQWPVEGGVNEDQSRIHVMQLNLGRKKGL